MTETNNAGKFDPTKPVQTRSGLEARILCTDLNQEDYCIVAAITLPNGKEQIEDYTLGGSYSRDGILYPLDLVNIPETSKPRHHAEIAAKFYADSSLGCQCKFPYREYWSGMIYPDFNDCLDYRLITTDGKVVMVSSANSK